MGTAPEGIGLILNVGACFSGQFLVASDYGVLSCTRDYL